MLQYAEKGEHTYIVSVAWPRRRRKAFLAVLIHRTQQVSRTLRLFVFRPSRSGLPAYLNMHLNSALSSFLSISLAIFDEATSLSQQVSYLDSPY